MNWRQIESGNLLVNYNFAEGVALQETSLLNISANVGEVRVYYGGESVTYWTNGDGFVQVDVSEYLRANPQPSAFTVEQGADVVVIPYTIIGLVDIYRQIIPQQVFKEGLTDAMPVLPPSKILKMPFGLNCVFGVFKSQEYEAQELAYRTNNRNGVFGVGRNSVALIPDDAYIVISNRSFGSLPERTYILKELKCGKAYAAVRWLNRFGDYNIMCFEVRDVSVKTNKVSLLSPSFNIVKGYDQSLTLVLRDLTPYDFWFYSDILTSQDVRVAMVESDDNFDELTKVNVVTDSVKIQNAGVQNLEIQIEYRRYDIP